MTRKGRNTAIYQSRKFWWSVSRSILDKKNWRLYLGLHLSCCHATLATFDQEYWRMYTMASCQAMPVLLYFFHTYISFDRKRWQTQAQSAWDIPYLNRKIFLFHYQIFKSDFFFVINFSYFIIRFLLNSSIVKSDSLRNRKS